MADPVENLLIGRAADPKKSLEAAIGKIGRAYGELLKVAEKHGDDISKEDYAKARYFLDETIKKIWDKVDVVRDVAKATSGEFSLDSVEMPEMKTITWIADERGLPAPPRLTFPEATAPRVHPATSAPTPTPGAPIDTSQMDGRSLAQAIGGRLTKAAKAANPRPAQSINTDLDGDDDGLPPEMTAAEIKLLNDVDFIDD